MANSPNQPSFSGSSLAADPRSPLSLIEERSLDLLDLVDSLNCGMVADGPEDTILFVNERIRQWLGYKEGELKGKPFEILFPDELYDVARAEGRAVEEGDLRAVITVFKRKDGTTFPVLLVPNRVVSQGGEFEGYVAVVADLGAVQTAKQAGYRAGGDLGAAIDRIATELQLLGISARALSSRPISFDHPDLQQLTPREREVLVQIAGGRRVPAMAKKLFISQSTVRNHLRAIYRKLGVESQGELVELLNRL